jgi:hypothetical protein
MDDGRWTMDDDLSSIVKKVRADLRSAVLGCLESITDVDDLATPIEAAMRANPVRQHQLVALGAFDQLGDANGVVGAAGPFSGLAQFSFWQRRHLISPRIFS